MTIREYLQALDVIDAAREARRHLKTERSLHDSILDAYEEVERTAHVNNLEVNHVAIFAVREAA